MLNPKKALLTAQNDADGDSGVPANVAVQRITQAASLTAWPTNPPSRRDWRISKELIALVGKVVEVEAFGVGEIENDFGTGCSPRGSQSAEFAGFEGQGDFLGFR